EAFFVPARRLARPAALHANVMTGRQQLDAGKTRDRTRLGEEREKVVDTAQVRPRLDQAESEQRLDLRGEQQPIALPRPEQRTDAEAIAAEDKYLPPRVP